MTEGCRPAAECAVITVVKVKITFNGVCNIFVHLSRKAKLKMNY
jgi:hypothetical protein